LILQTCQVILESEYDHHNRSFALCESCHWTATIFTKIKNYECPVCRDENIELIPLNLDEKYEYQLEPNKGLEIKFSINEEVSNLATED
jgi:hypothetical protein